jgi:hypothetical protein
MSDIPLARAKLYDALECTTLAGCKAAIGAALNLMIRDTPAYRVPATHTPMTRPEVKRAKLLRRQGMSVDTIAKRLGHNIGRISEAINGKRKGI